MANHHLYDGQKIYWERHNYLIIETDGDDHTLLDTDTDTVVNATRKELLQAYQSGDLMFAVPDGLVVSNPIDWSDFSVAERKAALFRRMAIKPLTDVQYGEMGKAVKARCEELEQNGYKNHKFSERSLRRWAKRYIACDQDIRSLIPNYRHQGCAKKRIHPMTESCMTAVLASMRQKRLPQSLRTIHSVLIKTIDTKSAELGMQIPYPSRATLARRIADVDHERRMLLRKRATRSADPQAQYDTRVAVQNPMAFVEIDHNLMDLWLVDPKTGMSIGRPTLTIAICRATRMIVGMHLSFDSPAYKAIRGCLYHMALPKNVKEQYGTKNEWPCFGLPHVLVVDNGMDFKGTSLDDAATMLDFDIDYMPVRTPSYKGMVERLYETINTSLIHTIDGTTLGKILRSDENIPPPSKVAFVSLEEITKILNIWIVDVYNESYHEGGEFVPMREWERQIADDKFRPRMAESAEMLSIQLGSVKFRTIQRSGVRFCRMYYNAPELGALRTKIERDNKSNGKVKIKYDPSDLGRIWVYNDYESRYIEAPVASKWRDHATGLSYWQHKFLLKVARELGDKVDHHTIANAHAMIQAELEAAIERGKTLRNHARLLPLQDREIPTVPPPSQITSSDDDDIDTSDWEVINT